MYNNLTIIQVLKSILELNQRHYKFNIYTYNFHFYI